MFHLIARLNKTDLDYGSDLNGDNINEKVDIYSETNVLSNETITVPAGIFTNTAKIGNDVALEVKLSGSNQSVRVTAKEKSFLAPNIAIKLGLCEP